MFGHIRTRIILAGCLLMAGGGALSTTLVSHNMSWTLSAAVDRNGMALANLLAEELREPLAYGDRIAVRRLLTRATSSNADLVYAFVRNSRGVVAHHSFSLNGFPEDLVSLSEGGPRTLRTEDATVRHLSYPIVEGVLGSLHLGLSMSWVDLATGDAVGNVALTIMAALAVGTLGMLLLTNVITRPLLVLRDAANQLGRGETDAEVPVEGPSEVADLAGTFNHMAAQIRARIAESEALRAYVERVLDQMESGIMVVSRDHRIEYANRVAVERHGSLEGGCCRETMKDDRPCDECPVPEVLMTGSVAVRTFRANSGQTYELKWVPIRGRDGSPAVVERALDVTERVAFQERFQRAHRLAVAGEIAAGVVHSVNNPLDGVRRALDLAQARPDDKERVSRMLDLATEGTDRIAQITRTLLGFARGDEARDRVPVQVDALVEAAVNLARLRAESKGLEIRVDASPDLPAVWLDPQAMEEVLVNILLNAVDACGSGGTAVVRARSRSGILEIDVTDTGPGVPAASARAVFQPFYTTKDTARGTGLGLPVARRIVEAHGGELVLDPDVERGARFVIRIPVQPEQSRKEARVV